MRPRSVYRDQFDATRAERIDWIQFGALFAAMAVGIACSPAATDTAVKSAEHSADLAVCRQKGMAASGDNAAKWRVYSECADAADARDKGRK